MEDYVRQNWMDYNGHFEYYLCSRDTAVCMRKLGTESDPERAAIIIELKVLPGNKEWAVQIRQFDNWSSSQNVQKSQFKWHVGTALYSCNKFAKEYSLMIGGSGHTFAYGIIQFMKKGSKETYMPNPPKGDDLLEWAAEGDIQLFISAKLTPAN